MLRLHLYSSVRMARYADHDGSVNSTSSSPSASEYATLGKGSRRQPFRMLSLNMLLPLCPFRRPFCEAGTRAHVPSSLPTLP